MRTISILLCLVASLAYAQPDSTHTKAVTRSTMIAIGATDILDTYISHEKYRGTEVRFISHTNSRRPSSEWSRIVIRQGYAAWADTRSGNGGEMEGMYNFQYGYLYNWQLPAHRLHIAAGATADASAGVLYNTHGGNNPAQARLGIYITPTASVAYNFAINAIPLTVSCEIGFPLLGVMFSPNYGQSYYEIFNRGNYDHNIVPVSPINSPSMHQMLAIDAKLGANAIRVGYIGDIRQAKVNGLKSHTYTHAFMVGITRKFSISRL